MEGIELHHSQARRSEGAKGKVQSHGNLIRWTEPNFHLVLSQQISNYRQKYFSSTVQVFFLIISPYLNYYQYV